VRYWLFAVNEAIPHWLILPGLRKQWSRDIVIKALPVSDGLIDKKKMTGIVDIWLEESCFLVRDVPVPRVSKKKIAGILELNLRQALPGGAKKVQTRAYRKKGGLYRQLVIKDAQLSQIEKYVEGGGATVRRVLVASDRDMEALVDNSSKTDMPIMLWWGFTCTCILFAVSLQFLHAYRGMASVENKLAGLENDVAELRTATVEAFKRAEDESEAFSSVSTQANLFNNQALRTPYLVDLTKSLPDSVWVSEFSVSGDTMRISGFSGLNIGDLVDIIRKLIWVQSIELSAPVSLDRRTGQSRFELSISVKPVEVAL